MPRIADIDQRRRWLAPSAACLLVLAGCSSGDDDASDNAEATTSEASLTVTWDGDACAYDGPTEFAPGAVTVEFVNNSDVEADMSMVLLDEDATFADFVEYHQPEPHLSGLPDFVTPDILTGFAEAGGVDTISTDLGEGAYALLCLQQLPGGSDVGAWVAQPGGLAVVG
ncbi:MAG: hypothetical protein WCA29_04365 [Jiangellales bacterium]